VEVKNTGHMTITCRPTFALNVNAKGPVMAIGLLGNALVILFRSVRGP
jgi:hypothetical protein